MVLFPRDIVSMRNIISVAARLLAFVLRMKSYYQRSLIELKCPQISSTLIVNNLAYVCFAPCSSVTHPKEKMSSHLRCVAVKKCLALARVR